MRLTPKQRAGVEATKARLRGEMTLAELRQARRLTQEALGAALHVGQPAIAKIEKRTDMYVGLFAALSKRSVARWRLSHGSRKARW